MHKLRYKLEDESVLKKSKILIIEDNRFQRSLLRQIYENYGFENIFEAEDGKKGLEETYSIDPDLVLLDINMPVMDGFEYCKTIRKDSTYKDMTILVQSGLTNPDDKVKIFNCGASDYITKPLDVNEVAARSFIHLERAVYLKKINEYNNRIKAEISSALNLIDLSLPQENQIIKAKQQFNIDIASEFQSSSEMGGDFWGFHPIDENKLAVYIIDVSGHGLHSALNALRIQSLLFSNIESYPEPDKMLSWLNKKLSSLFPTGYFATMFYGIINKSTDTLTYSVAACPPIAIVKNNKSLDFLSGKGFPVGAIKDATYQSCTVDFNVNDTLILYSDALYESNDKTGKILGEKRLTKLMEKHFTHKKNFSSEKTLNSFIAEFYKTCVGITDDLTINVYHRFA